MSTMPPRIEQEDGSPLLAERESVLVIDERSELLRKLKNALTNDSRTVHLRDVVTPGELRGVVDLSRDDPGLGLPTIVFSPLRTKQRARTPDVAYATTVLQACKTLGIGRFVLISSAEVYGAHYCHPGLVPEKETITLKRPNRAAERWAEIEELAAEALGKGGWELVILRPCWTLSADKTDFASRFFAARVAFPVAGFDNSIQLLSLDDLAGSIVAAIDGAKSGSYNVAPEGVIPIRAALRMTRALAIPVPHTILRWLSPARSREQLDFIRYSWTVSGQKMKEELKFQPCRSSAATLAEFSAGPSARQEARRSATEIRDRRYDDFGMDENYIRSCGSWQLGFMDKVYWRMEVEGLEHVPRHGGGVLAGPHRGFMPFDGVMMTHLLLKQIGRVPRFLMHPALLKFPYLATFLTRLGGVIACQENADRVLGSGELVGVFPEGIRGAFRMYERGATYRLGKFRDDYVKLALCHGVPIVPFVTLGPAETFPIFGRIDWPWWKRVTHWPFFPITATWPLLPAPLPTKWHIKFLEPIATCDYGPDAAGDRKLVSRLSHEIRDAMQAEIDQLLGRRRSVFWGSLLAAPPVRGAVPVERDGARSGPGNGPREARDVA